MRELEGNVALVIGVGRGIGKAIFWGLSFVKELCLRCRGTFFCPRCRGTQQVVNEKMESSIPGIYAISDVAGPPFFMAIARKEGMTAAKNICGENVTMDYDLIPDHT